MPTESTDPDTIVREIEEAGGVVIRGFRSRDELTSAMQAAIDAGHKCAFVPTRKTLREFLNTDGFIAVMNDVDSRLAFHEVLIQPNAYKAKHIFAIGPAIRNTRNQKISP